MLITIMSLSGKTANKALVRTQIPLRSICAAQLGRYILKVRWKMRNTIVYYFVLLLFILVSCSSPTDTTENSLSFVTLDGQLKITNNSNQTLYLFIVERGTAAAINWAPHFNDPKVIKYSSTLIDYLEIYNGSEEPVKSGDEVIVNYWDGSNKTKSKIYSKVIKL